VSYHETIEGAENGSDPIQNPENYENITEIFQTVYIRVVDDITGCVSIANLEIHTLLLESITTFIIYFFRS